MSVFAEHGVEVRYDLFGPEVASGSANPDRRTTTAIAWSQSRPRFRPAVVAGNEEPPPKPQYVAHIAEITRAHEPEVQRLRGIVGRAAEALERIKPKLSEVGKSGKNALLKISVGYALLH